jgi:hypothetical protein
VSSRAPWPHEVTRRRVPQQELIGKAAFLCVRRKAVQARGPMWRTLFPALFRHADTCRARARSVVRMRWLAFDHAPTHRYDSSRSSVPSWLSGIEHDDDCESEHERQLGNRSL